MPSSRKLNLAQTTAVEYIQGPLLIVAGAGTGKTTVITSKIFHLIKAGLAKPEEILALTFNDKAALEVQNRLDSMLDIGYADIQVSTFHAFCQRILESHAIDIGYSNQFKLLTETAAWLLIRRNLPKFNLDYYRPLGNPMKHVHELLKHFSKCKDELISPEQYLEFAEGTAKESGTVNLEEKNRMTELANVYHVYNQLLLDNARFDFGDLIAYTVKLFQTRPVILKKFQAKYKYILVDEFQDVNWAQYQLVQLLAGDNAQLTVVGDDDQSIYAFRGASVSNILRFKIDFPKAYEVVLNENFRSNQKILDAAYTSIQNNNPDRLEVKLEVNKKLKSARGKGGKESVVHLHAATLDEEVDSVITEIERLKQIDTKTAWDDFAILVRANNHAEPFLNRLEARGIPYEFLSSSGLYRQPIVLDAVNYLKILENHHESTAVFRLLGLPFLQFKENDLQKLTSTAKKKAITYYEALKRSAEIGLSKEGSEIAKKLIAVVHDGMKLSRQEKPSVVLYGFLEAIGYLQYLTTQEEAGNREVIRQIYHLKQFFEFIAEFETVNPGTNVSEFLEHFNLLLEAGEKGQLYQPTDTPDSVNIMTVHAAKGLEFKYVFIVNLVEERFPTRAKGDGIEIPVELVKEQLPEGDSHYQEERRLFYVAMTRAKDRLYFTSASDYGGARAKKLSRFLSELGYKIEEATTKPARGVIVKEKKKLPQIKGEFVFELPRAFSFSQIRSYETCPYQYKLAHILNIPVKGNASFSFGTTMHSTLQAFYLRIQELNSAQQTSLFDTPKKAVQPAHTAIKAPSIEELLALYDQSWLSDWYRDPKQREDYYHKGKEILKTFYKSHEDNWTIPVNLESWFKIKVGDYLMHGRIDRIDKLPDGTLEIIDYKTGKSKEKLTSEDKEQLLIYQIAVEQLPEYYNVGKPSKLTFYYLNDEIKTSFIGESKELEKLTAKLSETIDRIHAKDFKATPSQFACEHCDFRDICNYRV